MARYAKTKRFLARAGSAFSLAVALGLSTVAIGCRTTADDIERWSTTANGPRKLVAVLTHDKYPLDVRVEAAMAMVRMKPRGGRQIGLIGTDDQIGLITALESLPPAEREKIVSRMIPRLEEEMAKEPPKAQAGQQSTPDPSVPYKDAAFALLTSSDGALVQSDENRKRIRSALTKWCMTNFSDRMDESSQLYGVEQVLRELGADGVAGLAEQITPSAKKIDRMSDLIAELGDAKTKELAGTRLAAVAKDISSQHWIEQKAPIVDAANKASKLNPTKEQFQAQLEQYQEEELLRVFASMKKVGGAAAVDFLLDYAKNTKDKKYEQRRAAALAALEGNLDKNNPKHVQAVLDIASAPDTSDTVRDVALRRVGELPRKLVVSKLYGLFSNDNWKIRWVAGELVLKMSDTSNIGEFMSKIAAVKHMAITEPLRYGALMGDLKGKEKPEDVLKRYLGRDNSAGPRLIALGYYYEFGIKSELSKIDDYQADRTKVPECKEGDSDCEWKCAVGEGQSQEVKDIHTVGDFVQYCVKPAMEKRTTARKDDGKGK